ncbi:Aste57867_16973 [Aphanomyces stellatus]|uniref:Aste57867_16973 protein n=1 Tax=Aphanomyces stellatus TaxID=120398 RepID=A0A485L6P6_9STRA|nr:hypothetical protein As57867_016915 [Aphanomyces stellatus]VFT93735.1 Aste57867_16973 [Aphanomyces stellatus]
MTMAQDASPTLSPVLSSTRPGSCRGTGASADCAAFGPDYSCISVESNIPGMTLLSQCVKGDACGGNVNGKCPTFTNWPASTRVVQPICAFAVVTNCNAALNLDSSSASSTAAPNNKTVSCFQATFVSGNQTQKVLGIYKCVDQQMYSANNMGFLDLTPKHIQACAGNSTKSSNGATSSLGLCNAHGTCTPKAQFGSEYGCACNAGYASTDNCNIPVGNVCDAFGQCGSNGGGDPTTGQCVCKPGNQGNQCYQCDPAAAASVVCSNRGACGVDLTCVCQSGYEGLNCETVSKPPKPNTTVAPAGGGGGATSDAVSMSLPWMVAATLLGCSL